MHASSYNTVYAIIQVVLLFQTLFKLYIVHKVCFNLLSRLFYRAFSIFHNTTYKIWLKTGTYELFMVECMPHKHKGPFRQVQRHVRAIARLKQSDWMFKKIISRMKVHITNL